MRYEEIVYFVQPSTSIYDEETGDYNTQTKNVIEKLANVTDTSSETMTMLYGKITQGAKTFCIRDGLFEPFDYILYNGKRYDVKLSRRLRNQQVFQGVSHHD